MIPFGVVTPLATSADAAGLVTTISENLIANLPFIFAIVGFGIVFRLVMRKVSKPMK